MRHVETAAAWLVAVIGIAHLAVGHAVFTAPTSARVWFASAGFLLIVTGLTNLAARDASNRLQTFAALVGAAAILIIGALIAAADPKLLWQPQTLLLLALGLLLMIQRVRDLIEAPRPAAP